MKTVLYCPECSKIVPFVLADHLLPCCPDSRPEEVSEDTAAQAKHGFLRLNEEFESRLSTAA